MTSVLRDNRGSSLIEVLIASALTGLFVAACAGGVAYGVRTAKDIGRKNQAVFLSEEGLAAAQNMRDESFANLVDGTWGMSVTGSQWELVGTPDVTGEFVRSMSIQTVDALTKEVTSTVTWSDLRGVSRELSLVTYFTDWRSTTATSAWVAAVMAGSLDLSGGRNLLDVVTDGNYAYAIRDNSGSSNFFVFDVSTSSAPVQIASLNLSGIPSSMALSGSYVYVASSANTAEMQVVNISTPSSPMLAASYNASGNTDALGIAVSGTTAYVTRGQSGSQEFLVLNVAVPSAPVLLGGLDLASDANKVAVSGNYAYVASSSNTQELQVIDVTLAALPALLGGYDIATGTSNSTAVTVSGTTVYLGNADTVYVLSDATHGAPTLLSSQALGGTVNDLELVFGGSYLFVASATSTTEFVMLDVTVPSALTTVSTLDLPDQARGIAYNDELDIAVVADDSNANEFIVLEQP